MHGSKNTQFRTVLTSGELGRQIVLGWGTQGTLLVFTIFCSLSLVVGRRGGFIILYVFFCTSEILHIKIFLKKLQARSYLETLAWEGQQPDMGKFLFSVHLAKHRPGSHIQDMLN